MSKNNQERNYESYCYNSFQKFHVSHVFRLFCDIDVFISAVGNSLKLRISVTSFGTTTWNRMVKYFCFILYSYFLTRSTINDSLGKFIPAVKFCILFRNIHTVEEIVKFVGGLHYIWDTRFQQFSSNSHMQFWLDTCRIRAS